MTRRSGLAVARGDTAMPGVQARAFRERAPAAAGPAAAPSRAARRSAPPLRPAWTPGGLLREQVSSALLACTLVVLPCYPPGAAADPIRTPPAIAVSASVGNPCTVNFQVLMASLPTPSPRRPPELSLALASRCSAGVTPRVSVEAGSKIFLTSDDDDRSVRQAGPALDRHPAAVPGTSSTVTPLLSPAETGDDGYRSYHLSLRGIAANPVVVTVEY
ncbi:MAG: hypothetical protein NVS9B10_06730 [Nevskia sp.]